MKWLLPAVAAVLGFLAGLWIRVGGRLELDPKVRLSDVVNIAVTLVIALFIKNYVDERTSTRKAEKDFFVREINFLQELIQKVRETFSASFYGRALGPEERGNIGLDLRSMGNCFTRIERLAKRTGLRLPAETITKAKDLYFEYKVVVTGDDSVPGRPYAVPLQNQHENVCGRLTEELAVVVHEIIKC